MCEDLQAAEAERHRMDDSAKAPPDGPGSYPFKVGLLEGRIAELESELAADTKSEADWARGTAKLLARVAELEKAGFQLGEMLDYRVKRIMELEVELNRCLGSLGVLLATEGHVANWDGVRGIIEQAARVAK